MTKEDMDKLNSEMICRLISKSITDMIYTFSNPVKRDRFNKELVENLKNNKERNDK